MLAVTIGVGSYAEMARYAARAVQQNTGLSTFVIGDEQFARSGLAKPHYLKFRLFDLVDADQVLYFDADQVCLNPWNPRVFADPEMFVAVRDRLGPVIRSDAEFARVRAEDYFNSGLFIMSRERHLPLLRGAEEMTRTNSKMHFFDQTALNATRAALGLPLRLLDRRFNWIGYGDGTLCYQMPVFMAHRLKVSSDATNLAYYRGTYRPPINLSIDLNERVTRQWAGRSVSYVIEGGKTKRVRLCENGTLDPAPAEHEEGFWFVRTSPSGEQLILASEKEVLRSFSLTKQGAWESRSWLRELTSGERNATATIVAQRWFRYVRVGHDERRIELLPDGRVGEGRAACEEFWLISEQSSGRVELILSGRGTDTCRLTPVTEPEDPHGAWKGRWIVHEQMPVELLPVPHEDSGQ